MSDDLIRYDILTQEALRRVIRKVLEEVQRTGLPGEHHFFITFDTRFPGVRLSARMKARYPDEITIVIQHSYWNLEVNENAFEIDLSFDDIRERLRVPYAAISGFFDPSVKFGLQFDVAAFSGSREETESSETETDSPGDTKLPAMAKSASQSDKTGEESGADVVSLDSFRKKK
jgi:uncharacterized protein